MSETTYYQRNKLMILKRAIKYYHDNIEELTESKK